MNDALDQHTVLFKKGQNHENVSSKPTLISKYKVGLFILFSLNTDTSINIDFFTHMLYNIVQISVTVNKINNT